jgi:cysteine synthase A
MDGRLDAIVIGIGTGGTFSGVARAIKKVQPNAKAVAVETEGSVLQGGAPGPHKVEGIGVSFIPKTYDPKIADEVIMVSDPDAFDMVKQLARREGVLAGSSGGANVFAAVQVAKRMSPDKRVVTVIPDSAERYLSKNIFEGGK